MYIELHAASAFSFLDGASLPEALIERAAAMGYPALALLDRDGVYGAPRFHTAAKKAGIKAIVGAELTLAGGMRLPVLIESRQGYRNLCRLLTQMKLRAAKGDGSLRLEELDGQTTGLIALLGRIALSGGGYGVGGLVDRVVGLFGAANTRIELQRHLLREEEADNATLRDLAAAFHVPVIATNGVRFAEPADRPLYDVLTCIRHKTTLERAGRRLSCNAERYLKSPDAMARLFADIPEALAGTRELAERLEYTMADLGYKFPDYPVPPGETMASFLRKITQAGARERYRPYDDRARRQIERELALIEKLELAGYFLIVWDIVNFCRQNDILVQGRGSAANSAVCYSLGITAVDPIAMELLFERFLSEERGEWPDIDLDLPSGDRRERVIQHMYEKYGKLGAAMTANVITYRGRSAAREVGKVLSIPPEQIDRLAKVMNHFEWIDPKETLDRNLNEVGIDINSPTIQTFGRLWQQIQDLPRHLGQHSGGMVFCQGRLDDVVPLENASMPGRVVVQWDKDDCADMGLIKVDLLGLGMMSVIQDALHLVNTGLRGAPAAAAEGESSSPEAAATLRQAQGRPEQSRGASGGGATRAPRMMSVIQDALHLVNARDAGAGGRDPDEMHENAAPGAADHGPRTTDTAPRNPRPGMLDLAHLPPDDPAVYRMLQEADTVGIFQVESRAQMATLPRLRPEKFYDIVVEVAIIRPGPIVGNMVHPYLKRRQGQEPVTYPHPSLEPILRRTLGVPLFQEQLLRMAMVAAGFSGGEAEELRRAFGFKRSEKRMQQIEGKLRAGMERQGITGETAEAIIKSITSFALYGFPESHSASFALLVYASAYLKAHYPAAFYTAMLNNQPMGFYHPATLVKDAQRHGVRFAPIDVQLSDWECRVEPDGKVRLGLMYVNGLREEAGRAIATRGSGFGAGGAGEPEAERLRPERAAGLPTVAPARLRQGFGGQPSPELGAKVGGECREAAPATLRQAQGRPEHGRGASESARGWGPARTDKCWRLLESPQCPKCGNDDASMLEETPDATYFCNVCANEWGRQPPSHSAPRTPDPGPRPPHPAPRYASIEDLIARTGIRRDELATLAEIGALNALGYDRRSAQWQIEKAVRPAGELFAGREPGMRPSTALRSGDAYGMRIPAGSSVPNHGPRPPDLAPRTPAPGSRQGSPLRPMSPSERLMADYSGTSLTIGPHPMALRRQELALRGILRAIDLPRDRHGRRVRVAGAVITRQRPGTAKGFVFLTIEDETGIANIIVRPDLFTEYRQTIVGAPYLLIEGVLQIQEGVTSVKAERVLSLGTSGPAPESHDFR